MKCVALALALLASASAFVPSSPLATRAARTSSVVKMAVEDMPGVLPPMGFFDPAGISKGVSVRANTFRALNVILLPSRVSGRLRPSLLIFHGAVRSLYLSWVVDLASGSSDVCAETDATLLTSDVASRPLPYIYIYIIRSL